MHRINKDVVKKIFNQLSGKVDGEDELVPEMAIAGTGYIWCYEPTAHQVVRIARGIKCFVLDGTLDDLGRIMVYTIANDVILIEQDELIYTGFD